MHRVCRGLQLHRTLQLQECSRHKEVESGHQLKHRSQSVTERMEPLIRRPRHSGSFSFKELPKKGILYISILYFLNLCNCNFKK